MTLFITRSSVGLHFCWIYALGIAVGLSLPAQLAYAQAAHAPATATSPNASTILPTASTPHSTIIPSPHAVQKAQDSVNQIIFDTRYSHAIPQTRWEPTDTHKKSSAWQTFWENLIKHLKPSSSANSSHMDSGAILGAMIKTVVLLALLVAIVWLIIQRQKWLPWLKSRQFGQRKKQTASVTAFEQRLPPSIWQQLPAKSQLSHAVQQAIDSHNWQLALSLLYRGTLREVVALYDLPITQASTEQQCTWLLEQANYRRDFDTNASTKSLDEAEFFIQLVELWSQIAYGNAANFSGFDNAANQLNNQIASNEPNLRQPIERLLTLWQQLYLQPVQHPRLPASPNNPSHPTTSTLGMV